MTHALAITNVGKAYRQYRSQWQRVFGWFGLPIRALAERWVLRHVSFSVSDGESVGIVGQNGAGKSTLLKLVAGTMRPTEGAIGVAGDCAAILELGMGFSPELTGRNNAIHSLRLMGHSPDTISRILPEVEAFAEIGEYFDRPTRTYSSGMQMRVAFAVATAVRPRILIVDEALAVGDAYFQHKSFSRIREFRELGTSLLFVSHDRGAIQSICDRAILLDQGTVIKDGMPDEVIDFYNALTAEKENTSIRQERSTDGKVRTVSGTGQVQVQDISLYDSGGEAIEFASVGQQVELRITAKANEAVDRLVLGYMIKDRLGQVMYGTNTHHTEQAQEQVCAGSYVRFFIRFTMTLGPGTYSVSTALVSTDTHFVNNYEWKDLALVFTVANLNQTHFAGCAWMPPSIQIERG
jgi:lipopolysaccharide transport system ATP-binding protein